MEAYMVPDVQRVCVGQIEVIGASASHMAVVRQWYEARVAL